MRSGFGNQGCWSALLPLRDSATATNDRHDAGGSRLCIVYLILGFRFQNYAAAAVSGLRKLTHSLVCCFRLGHSFSCLLFISSSSMCDLRRCKQPGSEYE